MGVLLGPALLAFVLMTGLSYVMAEPPEPSVEPTALTWGGRVFTSPAQFSRWLEQRGQSYREWERRHPSSPWAREQDAAAAPRPQAGATRPDGDSSSTTILMALLGATLVLGVGVVTVRHVLSPRTGPVVRRRTPAWNGSRSLSGARPRGSKLAAAARPQVLAAGLALREEVERARPRVVGAASAVRQVAETAPPRLLRAGSAARRRVEAAIEETADARVSLRYVIATKRVGSALFYAFAALFSAAVGIATAFLF